MRDLDMSDVLADAANAQDSFLHEMYMEFETQDDIELEYKRYRAGPIAREGNWFAIVATQAINYILIHRHTSLCEGCLGRTGCDMCCPPDFSWMADAYNRDAEEAMLGRPLFPNEY